MKNRLIILTLLSAAAVACGPLGKYKPTLDPDAPVVQAPSWQEIYTDPCLQALIDTALVRNYDLQIAGEHIQQAKAILLGAKLSYIPTINVGGNIGSSFAGDGFAAQSWKYDVAASASWQLDIFTKINRHKSAKASVEQMNDYARATRSMLIADVANAYFTLLMLKAEKEAADDMEKTWAKAVETINALMDNGMADNVAVCQYEANHAKVQATARELQDKIAQATNALNLLLCYSAATPVKCGRLQDQTISPAITEMIPVEMLAARPDVQAAQRNMELAFYTTREAWLNFFPKLNLTGSIGMVNPVTGALSPISLLSEVGAGITMPILAAGANISKLKKVQSKQREARLEFDKTLLAAGIEVNDALNSYHARTDMVAKYQDQVKALRQASIDTEYLMKNSSDKTYLDVLIAYTSYFDAQFALIGAQTEKLQQGVAIYSAIGGGAQ